MKKLIAWAEDYLKVCTWKDMALLKFCLVSLGVLIGLQIPKKRKKPAAWTAGVIFLCSYAAVMGKFISVILRRCEDAQEEDFS